MVSFSPPSPLYIALVILYRRYIGWCTDDFTAHGQALMEFVDSTMFPRYDAGMLAAVGWVPPAGTTGLGETRAVQPFSCQLRILYLKE